MLGLKTFGIQTLREKTFGIQIFVAITFGVQMLRVMTFGIQMFGVVRSFVPCLLPVNLVTQYNLRLRLSCRGPNR